MFITGVNDTINKLFNSVNYTRHGQFQQYQLANTSKNHCVKNGNLGVTCTRLNIVGRRSPGLLCLSPTSYKDEGGEDQKAARHTCAIPNRFPPNCKLTILALDCRRTLACAGIGGMKKTSCLKFILCRRPFRWQQKSIYSSVLCTVLLFHAPSPLFLFWRKLRKVMAKTFVLWSW